MRDITAKLTYFSAALSKHTQCKSHAIYRNEQLTESKKSILTTVLCQICYWHIIPQNNPKKLSEMTTDKPKNPIQLPTSEEKANEVSENHNADGDI